MSLKEKYSIQEGYILPTSLIPGKEYHAFDLDDSNKNPEKVIIESISKDINDPIYLNLAVIQEFQGRFEHDIWKVKSDERIFKNYMPEPEAIKEEVEIKPTIKILAVKKRSLNEDLNKDYNVSLKPVPRKMQLGDDVIYDKKRGFIVGAMGEKFIVQCQYSNYIVEPKNLTSLEDKSEVVGYDQFKFDDKTQQVLMEQMVQCGIFMGNTPIKTTNCYVKYSDWKKASDDDDVKIIMESRNQFQKKGHIRILEDVNDFANLDNYIEGVIVDENTDEAIENVMINISDYTSGVGDAEMVRILRVVDETGEKTQDTLPKGMLRTLTV